ncbi:MAG: thioredoxin fold domain-containing protein [Balneolaceae bacterium]
MSTIPNVTIRICGWLAFTFLMITSCTSPNQPQGLALLSDFNQVENSEKPAILLIEADNCSSCVRLKKEVFTEDFLSSDTAANIQWFRANIDSGHPIYFEGEPMSVLEFAFHFNTSQTPTLLLFRAGGEFAGLQPGFAGADRIQELMAMLQNGSL